MLKQHSDISVAPQTGAMFVHILVICEIRAIKDYNLFMVYLVRGTS